MKKIIHYCWFGGKPLPRKVKKCINTWKKFLPDYEIKQWNENNFDINICPFVKKAYENKMWAFVSDYARIYALYKEGGLYLDTDVKIIKDISNIIDKPIFLGYEDSGYVGTAVIGAKEKENKYMKEILDYYDKLQEFNTSLIYNYANPVIISYIINKYEKRIEDNGITIFDNEIYVYPREFFYPMSYNYEERIFTDNTCMIHLFNATWTSLGERRSVWLYRNFGHNFGKFLNKVVDFCFEIKNKIINFVKMPYGIARQWYSIHINIKKRIANYSKILKEQQNNYLGICHPEWIGVRNSTKDIFKDDVLEIREIYTKKEAKMIAREIAKVEKKLVVFNAFAFGWEEIIKELKSINKSIEIRIVIHGSNSLLAEWYDWEVFNKMHVLYNAKYVDKLCFVKKSLYEFYKAKGYNTLFLMNDININDKEKYMNKEKRDYIRIGLYSSGDRWVKNTYNQLSAISLINNAQVECIPLNEKISTIAKMYHINLTGETSSISREELYKKIASNDINLYVTFTECAPLIPLESLELGTICITGDNHHYFKGTELEKYIVVNREDDIMEIYNKIIYALENKEKILELYTEWKKNYTQEAKENVKNFLKID